MTGDAFDVDSVFDEDYLYFYAARDEGGERSEADAELLWRLLKLEPGMEVLDLACGTGRIANRLASRGCRVTGLDATSLFLDRARNDAAGHGMTVEYVHGDMRELPWTNRFDRVVNWFTSFGYFDDEGNRRVLDEVARALRPGGLLAIELSNYVALLRGYQSTVSVERGGDLMVDRHWLEPLAGRSHVERTIIRDGTVRRVPYSVRLFAYPELRDWLLAAGFRAVAGFGEDGKPLHAEHRRMIAVARR